MKKTLLLASLSALALTTSASLNLTHMWTKGFGTSGMSNLYNIAATPQGDYLMVGTISTAAGDIEWGNTSLGLGNDLKGTFQKEITVGKFAADGAIKWSVTPEFVNAPQHAVYVASDSKGGTYLVLAATFNKDGANAPELMKFADASGAVTTITLPDTPEGRSPYANVVLHFDADGKYLNHFMIAPEWMVGSTFVSQPVAINAIAVDDDDNVYIGGSYSTAVPALAAYLPAPVNTSTGTTANNDGFILKLNPDLSKVEGACVNPATAPYAAKDIVSAIKYNDGKLYVANVVTGAEGCDYTFFGLPAEVSATVAESLAYGVIDCATMKPVSAAGATATYTAATTSGHRLQVLGSALWGDKFYLCGGINGGIEQDGKEIAVSTSKQIQTLTLAIDLATMKLTNGYCCGAGIGGDVYAIADDKANTLYTYGYVLTGGPASLRAYNLTTGELLADNVLYTNVSKVDCALFNPETKQFLGTAYGKGLKDIAGGASPAATATYSTFHGFVTAFTLNNVEATPAGLEKVEVAAETDEAPVEYFNLQGIRIANPAAGQLVIRKQGQKAEKVIWK